MTYCEFCGALVVLASAAAIVWVAIWLFRIAEACLFVRKEFRYPSGGWKTPSTDHRRDMCDIWALQERLCDLERRFPKAKPKKK